MLEVKNLSVKYVSTGQKVINNLSFSLKKGEVIAIMGPSGCGKTTLLNAIQGLNKDEMELSGTIKVDKGALIRTVFQEPRLLPWKTVFENLNFIFPQKTRQEVQVETEKLGLYNVLDKLPSQLSLGMQHRLNFLRAYESNASLILLDEPFSSLDHAGKSKIMSEFKQRILELGVTAIFVTHSEMDAKILAKKVIYLSESPVKAKKEKANV